MFYGDYVMYILLPLYTFFTLLCISNLGNFGDAVYIYNICAYVDIFTHIHANKVLNIQNLVTVFVWHYEDITLEVLDEHISSFSAWTVSKRRIQLYH